MNPPPPTTSPKSSPRSTAPSTAIIDTPKIGLLDSTPKPPRIVINATEGWGKTTAGAFAPSPVVFMARGESGFATLMSQGSVPNVPAVLIETWPALLAVLDDVLKMAEIPYKTLVFDALGGFERLCHETVCARDYANEWGERGFGSFQKGYDTSMADWLQFTQRLDRLNARGLMIILLSHCRVQSFKNPIGADYDRYGCDLHKITWAATHRWADAVLFGAFRTVVDKIDKRAKGIGGNDRVIYAQRSDAFDAKNRYGMPNEIDIPNDSTQVWSTISSHIIKGNP